MTPTGFYRLTTPWCCAGLLTCEGTLLPDQSAPILRKTLRKAGSIEQLWSMAKRYGWTLERLKDP